MPVVEMNASKPEVLPEPAGTPNDPLCDVDAAGISPLLGLQTALRFWWLLAGLMILGGLGGWLFHHARPPVYEAVVNFPAGIDFVQTGNMTQFEEDVALNAVGDLLRSDLVVNQVVDQANARGLAVDYQSIRRMTMTERKMNIQNLRVQHSDAALVEQVAAIWAEVGSARLNEAYQHAVQAERLDRYLRGQETCLEKAVVTEPTQFVCGTQRFDEVQHSLAEAGRVLAAERAASQGLFAGLRLGAVEAPVLSPRPVRYGVGQVVLAGSLLGLLLGVVLLHSGLLKRWPR